SRQALFHRRFVADCAAGNIVRALGKLASGVPLGEHPRGRILAVKDAQRLKRARGLTKPVVAALVRRLLVPKKVRDRCPRNRQTLSTLMSETASGCAGCLSA